MIKRYLCVLLLILLCTNALAQTQDSDLFQQFMEAYMGPGTNLNIGELPENFNLVFPEEITVLGTITRGNFPYMVSPVPMPVPMAMPPMGPQATESHEVLLSSQMEFTSLNPILDTLFESEGYSILNMNPGFIEPQFPKWGFEVRVFEEVQSINKNYCNEEFNIYINAQPNTGPSPAPVEVGVGKVIRLNINSTHSPTACQEQIDAMEIMQANMAANSMGRMPGMVPPPFMMIEQLPKLNLEAPKGSLNLATENIPRFPTPATRVAGIKLSGGWSSRTVLATPIMGEELRIHYDKQLKEQGWMVERSGDDGPLAWSEWSITDDNGVEWGGLLQIISNPEWQKGVAMPVFLLLEKP